MSDGPDVPSTIDAVASLEGPQMRSRVLGKRGTGIWKEGSGSTGKGVPRVGSESFEFAAVSDTDGTSMVMVEKGRVWIREFHHK